MKSDGKALKREIPGKSHYVVRVCNPHNEINQRRRYLTLFNRFHRILCGENLA